MLESVIPTIVPRVLRDDKSNDGGLNSEVEIQNLAMGTPLMSNYGPKRWQNLNHNTEAISLLKVGGPLNLTIFS